MKVERRYLDTVRRMTWEPRNLFLFQHEDENFVYACQPGMGAWLAVPTMPEDARITAPRSVDCSRLGLTLSGERFTWNDLLLHSTISSSNPREEVRVFCEWDGYTMEKGVLRSWLEQKVVFASLTPLHPVERYGNPFACVYLAPFVHLLPLLEDAGCVRAVFIPDKRIEVFGLSLTFPGNVRVSCSTPCVFRYPPILDEEEPVVVE